MPSLGPGAGLLVAVELGRADCGHCAAQWPGWPHRKQVVLSSATRISWLAARVRWVANDILALARQ